jgi:hypothetical protein
MIDAGAIYNAVVGIGGVTNLDDFEMRSADPGTGESSAMAQLAKLTLEKMAAALRAEAERSRSMVGEVAPLLGVKPKASAEEFRDAISAAVSDAENAATLVMADGAIPPGDLPGNFHKRMTQFSELRSKVKELQVLEALLALAQSPRTLARPTAAQFLRLFGSVNLYRQLGGLALSTAATYLEYLPNYLRSQHQTTSDPILTAFDPQYQESPDEIATLLDRVHALETEKAGS